MNLKLASAVAMLLAALLLAGCNASPDRHPIDRKPKPKPNQVGQSRIRPWPTASSIASCNFADTGTTSARSPTSTFHDQASPTPT